MGVAPKCYFIESPKILKVKILNILEAHNVLCRPLIEAISKEKL
jgi:hypothetical protein